MQKKNIWCWIKVNHLSHNILCVSFFLQNVMKWTLGGKSKELGGDTRQGNLFLLLVSEKMTILLYFIFHSSKG